MTSRILRSPLRGSLASHRVWRFGLQCADSARQIAREILPAHNALKQFSILIILFFCSAAFSAHAENFVICSKAQSEMTFNSDYFGTDPTSGMQAKLTNNNYFGPGGSVAPETASFSTISVLSAASLANCNVYIGGGFEEGGPGLDLSAAEASALSVWLSGGGKRFLIGACDRETNKTCTGRPLTQFASGAGVALNTALAYNPLTCGGAASVNTFGGQTSRIGTVGGDSVLATHSGGGTGFTGSAAAVTDDSVNPTFLYTGDADMFGSSGNSSIGNSPIASTAQAIFILNAFKYAFDALQGRLANPSCPANYNASTDLELVITSAANTYGVGQQADVIVQVANTSATSVDNVQAQTTISGSMGLLSAAGPGTYSASTGVWDIGTLAPGQSVSLTLSLLSSSSGAALVDAEIISQSLPDIDSAPNSGFGVDDLSDGINDDDEASASFTITSDISISGHIFEDNGTGGAAAHDGLLTGSETGLEAIAIEAVQGGAVIAKTLSNGAGAYTLTLPASAAGTPVTVQVGPIENTLRHISGSPGALPVLTDPDATDGTLDFVPVAATAYTNVDFGLVQHPGLTENRDMSITEGGQALFTHVFTSKSAMSVDFALTNEAQSSPGAFTTTFIHDANCNGQPDPGEGALAGPYATSAGEQTCLIIRATAAPGTALGTALDFDIVASGTYANTAAAFSLLNHDTLIVSTSGALQLSKTVCNATVSACNPGTGAGFGQSNSGAPGDTVIYRITFTSPGNGPIDDVSVVDATPAYSSLTATVPAIVQQPTGPTCALTQPAAPVAGYTGQVKWDCPGSLASGDQGIVSFEVRIDN